MEKERLVVVAFIDELREPVLKPSFDENQWIEHEHERWMGDLQRGHGLYVRGP